MQHTHRPRIRIVIVFMKTITATILLMVATTTNAATENPWIVSGHEVITEPTTLGDTIVLDGASLTVIGVEEPGLELTGNLWVIGSGQIHLEDSVIRVLARFHGELSLAAVGDASVMMRRCDYRIPPGVQNPIIAAERASVWLEDSTFGHNQLISLGEARLTARHLDGHFEAIVQDDSHMDLDDIPATPGGGDLWVWVEFDEDSEALYSPPWPGDIERWSFPPPGSSGIGQTVTVARSRALLWPMLIRPGAKVTLHNLPEDHWIIVGLHLPEDATLKELHNETLYTDTTLPLGTGFVRLVDTSVDTWNLYPQADATVRVVDSHIGELLAMENSTVRMERTLVDGTGGYVGASEASHVEVFDSTLTCTVEATGDAHLALHNSRILPYPQDPGGAFTRTSAFGTARLLLDHSAVETRVEAHDEGLIGLVAFTNLPETPPRPGAPVLVCGWAGLYGGEQALLPGHWALESVDTHGQTSLLAAGHGVLEDTCMATWPAAVPEHTYRLRMILTDGRGRQLAGSALIPGTAPSARGAASRP